MKEKSPEMESDRGQRGKRGVGECVLCFVLRTTSVSPLDRDKDSVLDPGKCRCIFPSFAGRLAGMAEGAGMVSSLFC